METKKRNNGIAQAKQIKSQPIGSVSRPVHLIFGPQNVLFLSLVRGHYLLQLKGRKGGLFALGATDGYLVRDGVGTMIRRIRGTTQRSHGSMLFVRPARPPACLPVGRVVAIMGCADDDHHHYYHHGPDTLGGAATGGTVARRRGRSHVPVRQRRRVVVTHYTIGSTGPDLPRASLRPGRGSTVAAHPRLFPAPHDFREFGAGTVVVGRPVTGGAAGCALPRWWLTW